MCRIFKCRLWLLSLATIAACLLVSATANAEIHFYNPDSDYRDDREVGYGDTILFEPGRYNRFFSLDSSITLASWFMFTGNYEHIGATSLEGYDMLYDPMIAVNQYGSPDTTVSIDIIGLYFTSKLNNLLLVKDCQNVTLSHCRVMNNRMYNRFENIDSLTINNCIFTGNRAWGYSDPLMKIMFVRSLYISNTAFADNDPNKALWIKGLKHGVLDKLTLYNSEELFYYWVEGYDVRMSLTNSIFWERSGRIINFLGTSNDHLDVDYCLIRYGERGIRAPVGDIQLGDNIIDEEPLTYPMENWDFAYEEESPCIDAGDPDSPLDPDGTRANIGASHIYNSRKLCGKIEDAMTGYGVSEVEIYIDPIQEPLAITDQSGYWEMLVGADRYLHLRIERQGFERASLDSVNIGANDSLYIETAMCRPELYINRQGYDVELAPGDTLVHQFNIFNDGNAVLDWNIEKQFTGADFTQFDILEEYNVSEWIRCDEVRSALYAHGKYYFAVQQTVADRTVNLVYYSVIADSSLRAVEQPQSDDEDGFEDMAYDPDTGAIWASIGNVVYRLDEFAEVVDSFVVDTLERHHNEDIEGMAWDTDRHSLIFATSRDDFYEYSSEGEFIRKLPRYKSYAKALAYRYDDPDGFNLYINDRDIYRYEELSKINLESDSMIQIYDDNVRNYQGNLIAMEFAYDRVRNSSALVELRDGNQDRIYLMYIGGVRDWVLSNPNGGTLELDEETTITLTFDARRVVPSIYAGSIKFLTNDIQGEYYLPVTMRVVNAVEVDHDDLIPTDLAITSVAPNPFNSSTTISYTLPQAEEVSIVLYDINGRLVRELFSGYRQAGYYGVTVSGADLTSGTYLLRLGIDGQAVHSKLILVK